MKKRNLKVLFITKQKSDFSKALDCLAETDNFSYTLEWSSSSGSALQKINKRHFDVVFMSGLSGGFSGINLVKKIALVDRAVSIVVVSRNLDPVTDRKTREAGAFDILDTIDITAQGLERLLKNSSDRSNAKREIKHMSEYDILTNLPNRSFFRKRMQEVVGSSGTCKLKAALLYIDLDNLKLINDSLGHAVGDCLISLVAERLQDVARDHISKKERSEPVLIARIGSDDFAFFIPHISHETEAAEAANVINESLENPFFIQGNEVYITASIGISLYPEDGNSIDNILSNAHAAMRYTKRTWKNNYCFYKKTMNSQSARQYSTESSLRKALERDELLLHFQPRFDIKTFQIAGMEALVRWNHPERGIIPPAEFIPIAEETGLIHPIGEWVLEKACQQLAFWHKSGVSPGIISVNLSIKQCVWPRLAEKIDSILSELDLDAKFLELELTESIMDGGNETLGVLNKFQEMGIKLAMDDLGTGYSSLSQLKRFPLDTIKIDRSFVSNIDTDSDNAAIVTAIIVMAQCLNLEVIAEGVKTVQQMKFLSKTNCDGAQGFLFSRPIPVNNVSDLLALEKSGKKVALSLNN
ncbi:MAG: EAL domain-containing protein [Nitrospinota bacterium]